MALAQGRGALGVIPAEAAEAIATRDATSSALDFDQLRSETEIVGYPILPLVHQLGEAVRRGRPLRALGRDHAGHHGHRRRAADPRRR